MITEETILGQSGLSQVSPAIREMIDAGVFYGRKQTKTNPRMKPFIITNRGGVEIIDLAKTEDGLGSALAFLKEKVRMGGLILFVATQPAAEGIQKLASEFSFPVVGRRWIGGTLTNFKTISKRVEYLKKLRADLAAGALQKYTKKERLNFEREVKRLELLIGGLENMISPPEVIVVIDPHLHETAMREARRLGIPVIAFANTDADPDLVDHLVVGNNAARKSIEWFFEKIAEAIREGKKEMLANPPKEEKKEDKGTHEGQAAL